jgi:hypothetical protein
MRFDQFGIQAESPTDGGTGPVVVIRQMVSPDDPS